jgi:hypothetical protein
MAAATVEQMNQNKPTVLKSLKVGGSMPIPQLGGHVMNGLWRRQVLLPPLALTR